MPLASPAQVREARRVARLTRKELADRLGISASDVARYEDGSKPLSEAQLARFAEALAPRPAAAAPLHFGAAANDPPDLSLSAEELASLLAGVQRPAVQLAVVRLLQTLGSARAPAAPPPPVAPLPPRGRLEPPPLPSADEAAMAALRQDVARRAGRVGLRFRPLVNAHTAALIGFEGLACWRRADGTSPDDAAIRQLAARGGFSEQLDFMLLQEAAHYAAEWASEGQPALITLGVSPAFLADSLARRALGAILRASGARPETLGLMVAPAILSDAPRLAILRAAAELGLRICVDGFLPEHLPQLAAAQLPVHLARLAATARPEGPGAEAALASVQDLVRMLRGCGALALASGANSAAEAAFWGRAGVDVVAGSWYSEALSPHAAAGMLQSNDNLPWSLGTSPDRRR